MNLNHHIRLMAEYNHWMNQKIYAAAAQLTEEQLFENRGAFFGSVFATLDHIAVADIIWLKRFSYVLTSYEVFNPLQQIEYPSGLNTSLRPNLQELKILRDLLDDVFLNLSSSLPESVLVSEIHYKNMKGDEFNKNAFSLLMHAFNHQTHHRGQATTLFSQLGIDIGATDLSVLIPDL